MLDWKITSKKWLSTTNMIYYGQNKISYFPPYCSGGLLHHHAWCLQLEKFGEMITLHNKRSNNVNKHHTVSDIMYIMKIMQTFTTTRANTILDYSNPHIWINKFARCQILFSIEFFKVKACFFFIFGQFFCLAYLMIFKVENERWFLPHDKYVYIW